MRLSRKTSRASARFMTMALTLSGCATGCATLDATRVPPITRSWQEDGFSGQRITTDHFELRSTLQDAEFERALPAFMEAAYERYEATLPARSHGTGPRLTMYLFATRGEWARFTRTRFPARYDVYMKIRSGGYTEGSTSVSFYTTRASTLAAIAHEGWHQYVASRFRADLPAWINEGLACYHEAVHHVESKPVFTPRHNTFRINSLRNALQQDTLMTLSQLVSTNAGAVLSQDDSTSTQTYYAQTWALITFLRHGGNRRSAAAFERLLGDIADGTFSAYVGAARLSAPDALGMSKGEAAFRAYFGCAPEDLSEDYREHVLKICGL